MATRAKPQQADLHQEELTSFLLIRTDEVDEGERLRPVDPVWAQALGQMMARDGQDVPIQVCRLPGRNRWTLVAGAHRRAGAVHAGIEHLKAEVVSADRDERRLREVRENLWRSDLTPIDRAAFIAEAVAIHKRQAGLDPERSGGSLAAEARWKKAVSDEAADATATIAIAYGWSEKVGEQIGLSARTVRDDLMLYRGLPASIVERLRGARHPIMTNASQLRALAKLEPSARERVVDKLLGTVLNGKTITSVSQALSLCAGAPTPADPDAKRLSAFIGAFSRMGIAEKKGALAQLAGMLPAGFSIVEGERKAAKATFPADHARYRDEALERIDHVRELIDGLEEDEAIPGDRGYALYDAGRALQIVRLSIAGNGFELGAPASSPAPAASVAASKPADADIVRAAVYFIARQLGQDEDARSIIHELTERFGARVRFVHGTNELKLGKVMATSTAGGANLLTAWVQKARKHLGIAA